MVSRNAGRRSGAKAGAGGETPSVDQLLGQLKKLGSKPMKARMGERFGVTGVTAETAYGTPMGQIQKLAKGLHRAGPGGGKKGTEAEDAAWRHELAERLWRTGQYEGRMLAVYVEHVSMLTAKRMDAWCAEFDNWAVCDTACFHLFDKTPLAWGRVEKWAKSKEEFVKRAAFALLASLALHDKTSPDEPFHKALGLVERAASDERNFVKKGVNWALRGIGRRSASLHEAAVDVARRLATDERASCRWVGKDALRELTSPKVVAAMKGKRKAAR